jgi:hypothetical protein
MTLCGVGKRKPHKPLLTFDGKISGEQIGLDFDKPLA